MVVTAAAQTIVIRDGIVSTKLNLWGFKKNIKKKKGKQNERKIFAKNISDKRLESRMYKNT